MDLKRSKELTAANPSEKGLTLLEAYSALASRTGDKSGGTDAPFAGRPQKSDPEGGLWSVRLQHVD